MSKNLQILALDPSTVATGWCLLDTEGQHESVIASGVFHPRKGSLDDKLLDAFNWVQGVIEVHGRPDVLAIETPFFKLNARTLFTLSSLGAAFRLAATKSGIEVVEISPSQRCTAVGMPGNAAKEQVLYAVNAIYNLNLDDFNESDAIAIGAAAALALRMAEMKRGDN